MSGYLAFAEGLLASGLVPDPWFEGEPRFRSTPVVLRPRDLRALHGAAEAVTMALAEAYRLCMTEPGILDDFLVLTPCQRLMALAAQPHWHVMARADVFRTQDGRIQVCEVNSDTPTGQPEAVATGALAAGSCRDAGLSVTDPNQALRHAFAEVLEALRRGFLGSAAPRAAAVLYPTEMTEDLPLVTLLRRWLGSLGYDVQLGSPFNVEVGRGGAPEVFGVPCPVVLRHYKTDWWGERLPAWTDDPPFANPLPLAGPLTTLLEAQARGDAFVVNPFGAVVTQNKRLLALLWEEIARFSPATQEAVRTFIPYTVRVDALHREQLSAERSTWVLKSDYGCEGEEVVLGPQVTQAEWDDALHKVVPERWVAQRYFHAQVDECGESVNHGVYLFGGKAAGLYARVQQGGTRAEARSAPALVVEGRGDLG